MFPKHCRYATEVDVDFVRKAVRAIGRCAIKVETSAERCVSTLLDLIQTKVGALLMQLKENYVQLTLESLDLSLCISNYKQNPQALSCLSVHINTWDQTTVIVDFGSDC